MRVASFRRWRLPRVLRGFELELSRRAYQRQLRNLQDHPRAHCAFRLDTLLDGRTPVVREALEQAGRVTPADVAEVAAGCTLDTVFLLEGRAA